jgi:predicted glycosyltransferase
MVDIWLDAVTPKDSLLVSSLLPPLHEKGYKTIVTAKTQTQTTDVLELLNVPYTCVGKYGETLREKLAEEQKRTLGFLELFDKIGLPKVLWTHGDVGAIRTAFGLQIPIVYSNDTPHALHVARLVSPLVDWLVAPLPFGKTWSRFGIPKSKIILYDGVEEAAWLREPPKESLKLPEELAGKKRIVLFRNAEYKAAYCKDIKIDTWRLIKELSKMATVLYLPRYEEEKGKLAEIEDVLVPSKTLLTFQMIPAIDLMVGSGGSISREAALLGVPTISFQFWDVIARYLHRKGFPIQHVTSTDKIVRIAKRILASSQKFKINTARALKKLEDPVPLTVKLIEKCLKTPQISD